ncbi:MAG: class I SAM-dependent methyltransferase [Sporichthyaceae bacterium]
MTVTATDLDADAQLKVRHKALWALGDYPTVSGVIAAAGAAVVQAAGITAGMRVLDVAAGSGNASLPAAAAGAEVVASDLCPNLLAVGEKAAATAGLQLRWEEADAENLPYAVGEFDAVLSCVGVMFAPHHARAAGELLRVLRPGGTLALLNWTPSGFIGQMFATMKPFAPPPPPGASPPPLWGDPEHVRSLLGEGVDDLQFQVASVKVDAFADPPAFREFFKANYGPTIAVFRNIADDPAKVAELDAALVALAERFDRGDGSLSMQWEYLLVTAKRRG